MPSNRTKYTVQVPLDPENWPGADKSVIWDDTNKRFDLGDAGGSGITYCQTGETYATHTVQFGSGGDILASPSDNHVLVGDLYAAVLDKTRYQVAQVTIGWVNDTSTPQFNISVRETVRFPSQKVIFNINNWSVYWIVSNTALSIFIPQYTVGSGTAANVDYCMNYKVF